MNNLPAGMDTECIALCEALNKLPGIMTVESCCGHGKQPYHVWFQAADLEALPQVCYWFDGCHSGEYGWRVIAQTDCGMSPVSFMIEGSAGAFDAAVNIAELMRDDLVHPEEASRE